jgi:hypothetical protein
MSINSRLGTCERSFKNRELVLFWLKTMQALGGFSDYWKFGDFESWPSESQELGYLYGLVFEVNSAVMLAACRLREHTSWASLFGIAMLNSTSTPTFPETPEIVSVWREKVCKFAEEVVALGQAVELISGRYFDGHEVLFGDTQQEIACSHERARLLAQSYNCFADENDAQRIDMQSIEKRQGPRLAQLLNDWSMTARSKALAAQGKIFEARDEVVAWLTANTPTTDG